jgi:hypothetical protein
MRFSLCATVLIAAGCASSPPRPELIAFKSCFTSRSSFGWSYLRALPANAESLSNLWNASHPVGESPSEHWFLDSNGQILMCSVHSPERYVFTPSPEGWKSHLEETIITAR